jgi:hypothetical protein
MRRRGSKERKAASRRALILAVTVLVLNTWSAEALFGAGQPQPSQVTLGTPSGDPANSPMGTARGIFPGRVTWIRDTNATPWDGMNGYWWQDATGVNQAAVDRMISASLRVLTGTTNDTAAWDQTFKYYNSQHGHGSIGYAPGEKIAIKINLNNSLSASDGNKADASKQTVLAILRQLVNQAGVPQTNITVYDATRVIPSRIYEPCHQEFPSVQWVDSGVCYGQKVTWVTNGSSFSVTNYCGGPLVVPSCVSQATYLINMPLLKGHGYAGVTLAGKNNYGSIPSKDHSSYLMASEAKQPLYSMLVDLMGSRELGGKTILYVNDGLFGNSTAGTVNNRAQCAFTNLFNGQWSASIFMSFDPVAIDSVCADFLYAEFGQNLGQADDGYPHVAVNCDHYLHEAALADQPPSGTVYRPDGVRFGSLGAHEHWNNPADKQYSRNLSTNETGIELLAVHSLAAPVTLISPTNGALFSPGENISLQAAHNSYTTLSRIDYCDNGLLLGTSTAPPWGFVWTNPPAGNWVLTAAGTDIDGYEYSSAAVGVRVLGAGVAITDPGSGTQFVEGTNLAIQTGVFSDFGSVTQVTFCINGSLLGSRSSAPFSIVWSNLPAGNWSLSATVRDSVGLSATSSIVSISVLKDIRVAMTEPSPRTVFPPGTNISLSATASYSSGGISRVDFYDAGMWLGSASASPYSIQATNLLRGAHSLYAVAMEAGGSCATSAVVTVGVALTMPVAAGTLYVDLRADTLATNSMIWANQGLLGNFAAWGKPVLQPNVANTRFPGVFTDFKGPNTVSDIDGSSDRSIEIWALESEPLGATGALVSMGSLAYNSSFTVCYGADLTNGAFIQGLPTSANCGWGSATNVPEPGVWHHLAYVYDGATHLSVYVDGQLSVVGTLPSRFWTDQSTPIFIGVTQDGGWPYNTQFYGFINSVRVHGGTLSAGDVWLNYLLGPTLWQPSPVTVSTQPADVSVPEFANADLSVVPNGIGPFGFQWYRDGLLLPGATNSAYALSDLHWADSGSRFFSVITPPYDCPSCIATSRTATITVQPQLPVIYDCLTVEQKQIFGLDLGLVPGGLYRVDYTDDLRGTNWIPVEPEFTASASYVPIDDRANYFTNRQRYYRVVRLR